MNKFISMLKTMSKGDINGMGIGTIAFVAIVALGIIATFPLILVLGLQLLGLPVTVSFKSWLGSVLIMIFLTVLKSSRNESK
jgi:predicted neutral ceramidase superfamily lipid hydrolase